MATISWTSLVSGDWTDPTMWSTGSAPGTTDVVLFSLAGAYLAGIAEGETVTVGGLVQDAGTVDLAGDLTVNGNATIGPAGVLTGGNTSTAGAGLTVSGGTLLVQGVIDATAANGTLLLLPQTLTVQGVVQASNGAVLGLFSQGSFTNFAAGVLTGGTYEADGASAIDLAPYDSVQGLFPDSPVVVDEAAIILNGIGSAFFYFDHAATGSYSAIETSLTTIGTAGVLDILGGRDYITSNTLTNDGVLALGGGTLDPAAFLNAAGAVLVGYGTVAIPIANGGLVEAQLGTLTLAGGITDAGQLQTDPLATLSFSGNYSQPISNSGTIEALSGTLALSGAISGSGGFFIQGGTQQGPLGLVTNPATTLDLATATGGEVTFNGPGGALVLANAAQFTGAIVGFGIGDTIDLGGVVSDGATLNAGTLDVTYNGGLVYALPLVGDYSAAQFSGTPDGSGGTAITVSSGVQAQDFSLEGPAWASKVITWSLAQYNYGGTYDSSYVFSDFIDPTGQAAYLSVIEQALARWAQVSGITFQQVADSATSAGAADIRIGWGDMLGASGEIGQAAFQYLGNNFLPDTILRLEDPVLNTLTSDPGVIGGYVYSGTSSTLYQVAVHELGHALGLYHSTNSTAVMYPTATGAGNQDVGASDIAGIQALYDNVPCFAAGTRVLTAAGEVAVEALAAGDRVACVLSGRLRRVRWVGRRTVAPSRHARPEEMMPVRIAAAAFGPGMPARDLRLSPDHAVFAEGALIPVRHLIDGEAVRRERVVEVTYVHVELADETGAPVHDVILAEGMPAETFLDTGNRDAFAGPAMALHPRFARAVWDAQGCAPLAEGGKLVERVRARLRPAAAPSVQGVAT